jgi:hypothetical protein
MNQRKRGKPRKDPNQINTSTEAEPAQTLLSEKERKIKYKKLQLYYYLTIGREYINSSVLSKRARLKIQRKLDILDKLNIPHLLGSDKILSPANLTDWFNDLYQYRFELKRLRILITPKTRLASAAQLVVRLIGLDIVYFDKVLENGRYVCRYRGARPHTGNDSEALPWQVESS